MVGELGYLRVSRRHFDVFISDFFLQNIIRREKIIKKDIKGTSFLTITWQEFFFREIFFLSKREDRT